MIYLEEHSSVEHSGGLLGRTAIIICRTLIALAQSQNYPQAINLAFS